MLLICPQYGQDVTLPPPARVSRVRQRGLAGTTAESYPIEPYMLNIGR